jgi:hypothetical protein
MLLLAAFIVGYYLGMVTMSLLCMSGHRDD